MSKLLYVFYTTEFSIKNESANMKKKVFITRKIPDVGLNLLREKFEVVVSEGRGVSTAELRAVVSDCHGLVSLLSDPVDEQLFAKAAHLQIVANYAVGYNNIDINAAKKHDIWVTHTPGVLTRATAEIAFALMIGLTRRIIPADRFTREGKFVGWDPLLFLGDQLQGKTLGIIGMGRIGVDMAEKALAFGMKIVYHNRNHVAGDTERRLGARLLSLDELLARSDVISVHTPLTPDTRHLLDKKAFEKMKKGVYIINTARGEVIDEQAMIHYLKNGQIKGVGLDVYEFEPKVSSELHEMENVILLPHIGSATIETRNKMSEMVAKNVISALDGQVPPNLIPEMK